MLFKEDIILFFIKRDVYKDILEWKNVNMVMGFGSKTVLRLDGARQVGKTTLVKEFGKNNMKHVRI